MPPKIRALAPVTTGALAFCLAAAIPATAAPAQSPSSPAPSTRAPSPRAESTLPSQGGWDASAYRGDVDVVPGPDEDQQTLDGVVFDDRNRNSEQDRGERGIKGVTVSNGRDVTTTDAEGRYTLPAHDNMDVFVTQPAGYQVPVDEDNIAQFSYTHLPEGSPDLTYGGIDPTGPLPDAVNFPMARSTKTRKPQQNCIMGGDIQTYTQQEVEYARKGAFSDLAERSDYTGCGALFLGDIVGNDLSLYPQTRELTSMINGPARLLPGNHDLDFDARRASTASTPTARSSVRTTTPTTSATCTSSPWTRCSTGPGRSTTGASASSSSSGCVRTSPRSRSRQRSCSPPTSRCWTTTTRTTPVTR